MLCVRLVFCLYAEDAGLFGKHSMFHDYLVRFESRDLREAIIKLFKVLDTKQQDRDPYLDYELAQFPYVNGGLFADENIEIPNLNEKVKEIILSKASEDFDWSDISPTIFGAVFESTLNPETRRKGGMHYTSIENIHKVIDPLFLDELKKELEEKILNVTTANTIKKNVLAFQEKISKLKFLDPACGSGNFLTETYLSLRKLENQALEKLYGNQIQFGDEVHNPIKVSISQFYGIEINDFAVTVAKTALWIAESQMMKETENILHLNLDFLPLKSYANIVEGNALRIDWNDVVPKEELNYIMGNPPFVGYSLQSNEQKQDMLSVYLDKNNKPCKLAKKIDYVAGWYYKASKIMYNTKIKTAFVSTNSITQGEQVLGVWKTLYEQFKIQINFAYRTFKWNSESNEKAAVHCVIIGFSFENNISEKIIYNNGKLQKTKNITPYLTEGETIFIESRLQPISNVPNMVLGNLPRDGGFLNLTEDEKNNMLKKEPNLSKYIYKYVGSEEFINNKKRYCLWLVNADPNDIKNSKELMYRISEVKKFRENSTREATRKLSEVPTLFAEIRHPNTNYLLVPCVSSENRRYIPIGFMKPDTIVSNACSIVPSAELYHFGVLTSNVHNAWMRTVSGRLKSDYRYSGILVYNTFTWPNVTEEQKNKIEKTAQEILDARDKYPNSSLATLYDELTMPRELRKAHQENDKAVMEAYGFDWRNMTESDCVAELMKMYKKIKDK